MASCRVCSALHTMAVARRSTRPRRRRRSCSPVGSAAEPESSSPWIMTRYGTPCVIRRTSAPMPLNSGWLANVNAGLPARSACQSGASTISKCWRAEYILSGPPLRPLNRSTRRTQGGSVGDAPSLGTSAVSPGSPVTSWANARPDPALLGSHVLLTASPKPGVRAPAFRAATPSSSLRSGPLPARIP